jgi:hypothetical protein
MQPITDIVKLNHHYDIANEIPAAGWRSLTLNRGLNVSGWIAGKRSHSCEDAFGRITACGEVRIEDSDWIDFQQISVCKPHPLHDHSLGPAGSFALSSRLALVPNFRCHSIS